MKTVNPCRTDKVLQLILTNDNKPSDKRMCELTIIFTLLSISKMFSFFFIDLTYLTVCTEHALWGVVSMLKSER
jgi:hypothetical protein